MKMKRVNNWRAWLACCWMLAAVAKAEALDIGSSDEGTRVFAESSWSETSSLGFASALTGIIYDLKRLKAGAPSGISPGTLSSVWSRFLKDWDRGVLNRYFKVPSLVGAPYFYQPSVSGDYAPKALGVEECLLPGHWLALYQGWVKAPLTERIRFVGMGDDYLAVRFDGKTVLESQGGQMCRGALVDLREGESYFMQVALANQDGDFGFALMWEVPGEKPRYLFRTNFSRPEKAELQQFMAPYLNGKEMPWLDFEPESYIWMVSPPGDRW